MNKRMYGFDFATGDVNYLDYGGTWVRHIAGTREFHFINLINWEDSCGEREAREIGSKYCIELRIVDLDKLTNENIVNAFQCRGQIPEEAQGNDEWIAEACMEYGLHAPIESINTSNFHATFKALAKQSRAISGDKNARRRAMAKKVNKLGSTAAEFMRGDLNSALVRGVIKNDPNAMLLAKIGGLQFGKVTS